MDGRTGRTSIPAAGEIIDLFCGTGGMSSGFSMAGIRTAAGIDICPRAGRAFVRTCGGPFRQADIRALDAGALDALWSGLRPRIVAGGPPCQPFSRYARRETAYGAMSRLPLDFARLAAESGADAAVMENVAGLAERGGGGLLRECLAVLSRSFAYVACHIVDCSRCGVPQKRRRLIVIASRSPVPCGGFGEDAGGNAASAPVTVRQAIGKLPRLRAGGVDADDPLHRAARLSDLNLRRIRLSVPGGSWKDWPEAMRLACHSRPRGRSFGSVYGRMEWDAPAPTVTTQCYGYGNGRFGHPDQDRAVSLREAALLQSFPADWMPFSEGEFPGFAEAGRLIGNAVPPLLGLSVARMLAGPLRQA